MSLCFQCVWCIVMLLHPPSNPAELAVMRSTKPTPCVPPHNPKFPSESSPRMSWDSLRHLQPKSLLILPVGGLNNTRALIAKMNSHWGQASCNKCLQQAIMSHTIQRRSLFPFNGKWQNAQFEAVVARCLPQIANA